MDDTELNLEGELSNKERNSAESPLEDAPTNILEAIKELPPSERKIVSSLVAQISSGPFPSPIANKVTSDHISQVISNSERDNERAFLSDQNAEITKRLAIGAILLLVVIVLLYAAFTKDKELSEKVITAAISALGGFGVGLAVGKQGKQ